MVIKIDETISLKRLEKSDAADIFNTIDRERDYLGKWLPFVAFTKELSDSQQFVYAAIDAPEESFELIFTIRENDIFIGLIGFKDTDSVNRKTEIGYWLSEKYQKRGIVTRAVEILCEMAFIDFGLNRVQIKCAVGNQPSKNIPKRLRFKFEGIERQGELLTGGVFIDLEIYSRC